MGRREYRCNSLHPLILQQGSRSSDPRNTACIADSSQCRHRDHNLHRLSPILGLNPQGHLVFLDPCYSLPNTLSWQDWHQMVNLYSLAERVSLQTVASLPHFTQRFLEKASSLVRLTPSSWRAEARLSLNWLSEVIGTPLFARATVLRERRGAAILRRVQQLL